MPEFDARRETLAAAAAALDDVRRQLFTSREALRRARRESDQLKRRPDHDPGAIDAADRRMFELETAVDKLERSHATSASKLSDIRLDFIPFLDPTRNIENLEDRHPILLFPVRIETRFKQVDGGDELWLRIYPDDISVSSFEENLTEDEWRNTRAYWAQRWAAGGDEGEHRAAWKTLVKSHGSGRAHWLIGQAAPVNASEETVRGAGETLLVIVSADALPSDNRTAMATYWQALAAAPRDAAVASAAYDALVADRGASRAAGIAADTRPYNFEAVARAGAAAGTVRTVFLHFPAADNFDLQEQAWRHPARARALPDRFVVMGFEGGTRTLLQTGNPVPAELQVGPDPAAGEENQLQADGTAIKVPDELRWLTDFEAAIDKGMGFRIPLSAGQARGGFDRLLVLGIRMSSDSALGATQLETLLGEHLRSRKGCSLLAQGTPTNNVEDADSGYSWREDSEVSFDHYFRQDPTDDPADWRGRKDGRRLAEALGIDPAKLKACPNYFATDQAEARAMNEALWPATLGYFMDEMADTMFEDDDVEWMRDHFNRRVVGTGSLPSLRVGRQPYGVLVAAPFSRLGWFDAGEPVPGIRDLALHPDARRMRTLYQALKVADSTWAELAGRISPLGAPSADPYQALLDAVGLHSGSVQYYQRFAETAEQLFNRMKLSGLAGAFIAALIAAGYVSNGTDLLAALGHQANGDEVPAILDKLFLKDPNLLKGAIIDLGPVSEIEAIRASVAGGGNYLDWIADAARQSHDVLRRQAGFMDDKKPDALLYLMLRHAVDLNFVETAVRLHVDAGLMTTALARSARRVPKFFHVAEAGSASESPWNYLYKVEPAITGSATATIGRFVSQTAMTGNSYLRTQLEAIERLARLPTARLERAFANHIDCCSYRLDAWWMSLMDAQLEKMRAVTGTPASTNAAGSPRGGGGRGLYLGAYGWVENLRPEGKQLQPVEIDDVLEAAFNQPGDAPLMHDPTNQGLVHAPSLDHATTAAILRNGHLSHRTGARPDALAINLTSSRVRSALAIIEGIRNGQSLSSLLGYRFERGLHDAPGLFLDAIILDLRLQFPLRANKLNSTMIDDPDAGIGQMEARNVIDGLALVRHVEQQTGAARTYPFGLGAKLPALDPPRVAAVNEEVTRLIDVSDAVADLAMAEGVHQLVKGNLERAAANFDSYSKGHFPPIPDVIQTPREGVVLTHRVALHLQTGLDPDDPANITPRAKGEPAINRWLGHHLPPLGDIICEMDWFNHATGLTDSETVTINDLGLAPIDLLFMARDSTGQEMQALDQELLLHLRTLRSPRPDAAVRIRYHVRQAGKFSLFEVAPLLRHFEALLISSRALRATDVAMPNEGSRAQDGTETIDERKIDRVRGALVIERAALDAFLTPIETALDSAPDDPARITLTLDHLDQWIYDFAPIARRIARFGLAEASFAFAVDRKSADYAALVKRIDSLKAGWTRRLDDFDRAMTDYASLTTSAEDKTAFLLKSALLLTPSIIVPPSGDPDDLRDLLQAVHRPLLAGAIGALPGLLPAGNEVGRLFKDLVAFNATVLAVDPDPLDLSANAAALWSLAQSLTAKARALLDSIDKRLAAANDLIADAVGAMAAKKVELLVEAMQQLTSSDFRVLPEFDLSAAATAEWQAAQADSAQLLTYLRTDRGRDYPLDDWLHGTARVRDKMGHIEQAGQIVEAFGQGEIALTPLQFPYRRDDRWLALEFPELKADGTTPFRVDEDKLIYTAMFGGGVAASAPRQCGLLCDEWTEVLPSLTQTTGVTFHYDRPNTEAPQSLILALPATVDGSWAWDDLVDTLHETLDMARKRAVEPSQLMATPYGAFLPAVIASVAVNPVFQQVNFAMNNKLVAAAKVVQP